MCLDWGDKWIIFVILGYWSGPNALCTKEEDCEINRQQDSEKMQTRSATPPPLSPKNQLQWFQHSLLLVNVESEAEQLIG